MVSILELDIGDVITGKKPCKKCDTLYKIKRGNGWISLKCKCKCYIIYDAGYISVVDQNLMDEIKNA